uniref:Uncharacterized protein n=1 Tax=Kalanchoe fedtschenkoi TaxID=63787 RepID=A0A7N0V0Q3_KALFE
MPRPPAFMITGLTPSSEVLHVQSHPNLFSARKLPTSGVCSCDATEQSFACLRISLRMPYLEFMTLI